MDRLMRLDLKEIYSFEETIENIKIFKNTSKTNTLAIYYESHFKSVSTRFIASITTLKNIIEKEYPNVDPYKFMMFIFEYSLINKDQELDIHTAAQKIFSYLQSNEQPVIIPEDKNNMIKKSWKIFKEDVLPVISIVYTLISAHSTTEQLNRIEEKINNIQKQEQQEWIIKEIKEEQEEKTKKKKPQKKKGHPHLSKQTFH